MVSLFAALPRIAPILDMTVPALYERQRALVRIGLLPKPKGRGRGSGSEATPDTVAQLLIAVLATDSQQDAEGKVQKLTFSPFIDLGKKRLDRCPLTGKQNFKEALASLLGGMLPAERVYVRVSRKEPSATIQFSGRRRGGDGFSEFGHRDRRGAYKRFGVTAELPHDAIMNVRQVLDATTEGSS